MKKRSLLLQLCLLLFAARLNAAECETLIYSTNPQYPPYDWEDNGAYKGATEDLMRILEKKMNIQLKPVIYPWQRALGLAKNGEIDLVASLRITTERQSFLKFTKKPAFSNPTAVFVRRDHPLKFSDWKDLKKYAGVFASGDSVGEEFDKFKLKELSFTTAKTMEEAFLMLENKRIDFFITGRYAGSYYLRKNKKDKLIHPLNPNINEDKIYIGFSKKSKCLHLFDKFDKQFSEISSSGKPDKILSKYID